ncbi:hypothetical protein GCM10022255_058640 [Dactylosporangium darangshiense]|uniref:OmpR/PhoB-type domain-containing protein n=1 Tax=Dactylosporangium darangshiense TaxID=579108 RepID=A0ABP8DEW7_9ACTN
MGPLRVQGGQHGTTVSAHKMEILLAVLLIRSGQVVPISQLMHEVWGEHPPQRAKAAVHVYISQLRRFLARPGVAESPIVTKAPGYLLDVGPGEIDLALFRDRMRTGRAQLAAARHAEAVRTFEAALRLWRGPALVGLRESPAINTFVIWLEEARLECVELMVEANLALGRHRDMVGFLFQQVAEHPFREAFHRQLMLALYRSERQADALKAYAAARHTLNRELGLEPCRALRDLHRAILAADDRLYHTVAA